MRGKAQWSLLAAVTVWAWITVCVVVQAGLRAAIWFNGAVVATLVIAIIARRLLLKSLWDESAAGGFAGVFLWAAYVFATGWRWSDFLLVLLALGLTFAARRRIERASGFAFVLLAWALLSANTFYSLRPLPVDASRFQQLRAAALHRDVSFTVALSGGGYRAAIMHAGVLSALEDIHEIPTNISAVSGGAIVGSFYAVGGNPASLRDAVVDGNFNLKRELLALPNTLRLLFPLQIPGTSVRLLPWGEFSRTNAQGLLLDRLLYGGRRFRDLETDPAQPHILLAATNLIDGSAVGLTKEAILYIQTMARAKAIVAPPKHQNVMILEDSVILSSYPTVLLEDSFPANVKICDAVAASGAFPGAFQSLLYQTRLNGSGSAGSSRELSFKLADGGVADNSGITLALAASGRAQNPKAPTPEFLKFSSAPAYWRARLLLASDASAVFPEVSASENAVDAFRAVDIVYGRNSIIFPSGTAYADFPAVLMLSPRLLMGFPLRERPSAMGIKLDIQRQIFDFGPVELRRLYTIVPQFDLSELEMISEAGDEGILVEDRYVQPLAEDLADCLSVFVRTGTLTEQMTRPDAEKLFRLGQYLVFLEQKRIQRTLECFSQARDDPKKIQFCKDQLVVNAFDTYSQSHRGLPPGMDPDQ